MEQALTLSVVGCSGELGLGLGLGMSGGDLGMQQQESEGEWGWRLETNNTVPNPGRE